MKKLFFILFCTTMTYRVIAQNIDPMIESTWGQGVPYNNSCPDGTVAGCGPVAIGQILYYHKQPKHGYGSKTYQLSSQNKEISINYDDYFFDWDNILPSYSVDYSDIQSKAVSELLFQIGVAMEANYGTSTSVNNFACMLFGLQHYLHISPESRYLHRKYYSTAEWIEMINNNLNAGNPVFYRGDWIFDGTVGHMYVIDGKDENGFYHINWGNYGRNDKYVDINILNMSGTNPGNRGVCYNYAQAAVFNCFPTPDSDTYLEQSCLLNDPIIINADKNIRSIMVDLGENFTLGTRLRNCCDKSARITFSWVLLKDGDFVSDFFNSSQYTLSAGHTFTDIVNQNVNIPTNIEDGCYQLKMYWKSNLNNDQWYEVWDDAPNNVDVVVENGKAIITVPENRACNPNLMLNSAIEEVDTWSPTTVPGRSFKLPIVNQTGNNFEGTLKLELDVEGQVYEYQTKIAVYSQTTVDYHILIPYSKIDLQDKQIDAIRAYYIYDDDAYIMNDVLTGINTISSESVADIDIYDMNGNRIAHISADNIQYEYLQLLNRLKRGIYIIKEGKSIRKIKL